MKVVFRNQDGTRIDRNKSLTRLTIDKVYDVVLKSWNSQTPSVIDYFIIKDDDGREISMSYKFIDLGVFITLQQYRLQKLNQLVCE